MKYLLKYVLKPTINGIAFLFVHFFYFIWHFKPSKMTYADVVEEIDEMTDTDRY